jgi:O-antigen ligase
MGLLGTQSIHGRVRFRGTIEDPNELTLAVSIVMPLAFAFFERRRSMARLALLLVTIAFAGTCAVFTRSRGGQLVFLAVLGVYLVKRFGLRGLAFGAVCTLPIFLLGGRDPAEAASSTMERLNCWSTGLQLLRGSPVFGVGLGQFVEHHYQTAHNSFVLTAAELGFPGMVLWSAVVYLSIKIPVKALRARGPGEEAPIAQVALSWSLALLAALVGLLVGVFFLSYAYKEVFWIFLGLSGALYQAIERHRPSFRVRFGIRDLSLVVAMDAFILAAVKAYTFMKLGH